MPQPNPLPDEELDKLAESLLADLLSDDPYDTDSLVAWLKDAASTPEALKALMKFKHTPVGPREFVESPEFLNKHGVLWPRVLDALEEINDGTRTEAVLTGGIGVAKTTLALYTQAYQIYLLSCLRNPHAEFNDLDPSSEIVIVFQSLNKELAGEVDYARFRDMLEKAPYFTNHFPFDSGIKSEMRFPNRIVVKPISGQDTGAIGQNVIGGIIDEINFMAVTEKSKLSKDGGTHDQAIKNYNSISRRRESRFMKMGWVPGMLCLVSSRNYPGQFTDVKEKEAQTNPRIYVYDKRLWELVPERFSGKTFPVFVGDATRKPRLLAPTDKIAKQDEHLLMDVPEEYRLVFEADLLGSLRDIAGVATMALHPFILDTEKIGLAFQEERPSVLNMNDCDFVHSKPGIYKNRIKALHRPRFLHIDLSLSGDSTGVACGYVDHFKKVDRGDHIEVLPVVTFDFVLEVQPPKGGEIQFSKVRELIYTLTEVGMPVRWVSMDSFQSQDTIQILRQKGYQSELRSVDTSTIPYDIAKQAIIDERVLCPAHPKALREFVSLEFSPKDKKVDHPPKGSKDLSDAMASVIFGLTMMSETWIGNEVNIGAAPPWLKQMDDAVRHKGSNEGRLSDKPKAA